MKQLLDRCLSATLGGLAALTILGGLMYLVDSASPERGSGRAEIRELRISSEGDVEEKPKRKNQRTEIATSGEAQTSDIEPSDPPNPNSGNPRE